MFCFSFLLVPLYNVFCEITGLNGKITGPSFYSAQDENAEQREVLVQFISYIYSEKKLSFVETVRLALKEVVGAYGIVIMCDYEPDVIIAARFGSPLLLGIGDNEFFVASDSSPIIEYTRNIVFLDEGELAVIKQSGYEVRDINENILISKEIEKIKYDLEEIEKGGYDHFMIKEINMFIKMRHHQL